MDEKSLTELFESYRVGDAAAQEQFLRRIERRLLELVRQLIGPQIRLTRDSVDLTQSLLMSFHRTAMDGKVNVANDNALDAYLRRMVQNKLANVSDHEGAVKRGGGQRPLSLDAPSGAADGQAPRALDPTASTIARVSETISRLGKALNPEEMDIFRGRLAGRSNVEIAEKVGKTPDAVRMMWMRARAKLIRDGVLDEPA